MTCCEVPGHLKTDDDQPMVWILGPWGLNLCKSCSGRWFNLCMDWYSYEEDIAKQVDMDDWIAQMMLQEKELNEGNK